MKTIKSILALLLVLCGSISFAQPPGGGQKDGQPGPPPIPDSRQIEKMVSSLAAEISLSDAQKKKLLNCTQNILNR